MTLQREAPLRLLHIIAAGSAVTLAAGNAAAMDQCLTKDDLRVAGRMASVMAIGVGVQRCASCLKDRYAETLKRYEASDLLKDFWMGQAAIKGAAKIAYADDLIRSAARKHIDALSGECQLCERMADAIDGLPSAAAQSQLFDGEVERIEKLSTFKSCP
jgi:hypothetical protein